MLNIREVNDIKFNYSLDNLEINIFPKEIDNVKYLEIFVKENCCFDIDCINIYIAGITEYIYSTTSIERTSNYKEYKLNKVTDNHNIYYIVIEWNKLDAKFYFEYKLSNNEKKYTKIQEINYLNFEISKKCWNESVYFIMIDRFVENTQIDRWQNEEFYAGGTFKDVLNDLQRISKDGYSIVYLSPIMKSISYHGYNQMNFESINDLFGGEDKLKALTSEINKYNIKVGVELVTNHLSVFSNEFRECLKGNNDLFYITEECNYETYRDCIDLAKIKFENGNIEQIFQYIKNLIISYNVGFIRLDCCDYLDNSFVNLLSQYCKEKDILLTGECWSNYNNFFNNYTVDGATNYNLYGYMMNLFINKSINVKTFQGALIDDLFNQGFQKNNYMLNFIDNHDIDRISSLAESVEEIKLLLSFIFLYIGIPMIYYGTENYDDKIKSIVANRRCIFRDNINKDIEGHIQYLNFLRKKFINDKIHFESKDEIFVFSRDTYDGKISFIYNNSSDTVYIRERKIESHKYTIIGEEE